MSSLYFSSFPWYSLIKAEILDSVVCLHCIQIFLGGKACFEISYKRLQKYCEADSVVRCASGRLIPGGFFPL